MKRVIFLFSFLVLANLIGCGQGIKFFEGNWAEVLAAAKKQNKPIFVDYYTTWCGPCKWMAKSTFTDAEVGTFANANYISYKVDCEKGEGITLSKTAAITGYPTIIFYDATGKEVGRQVGALDAKGFLSVLQKYGAKPAKPSKDKKSKNTGSSEQSTPPSEDIKKFAKVKEVAVGQLFTELYIEPEIKTAIAKATELGIKRDDFEYFDFRKNAGKTIGQSRLYILDATFYINARKANKLIEVIHPLFESGKLSPNELHYYAWQFNGQTTIPSEPMRWLNFAIREEETPEMWETKAYLQYKDGKNEDALQSIQHAIKLAKAEDIELKGANDLLGYLKGNQTASK